MIISFAIKISLFLLSLCRELPVPVKSRGSENKIAEIITDLIELWRMIKIFEITFFSGKRLDMKASA